MVQAVREFPAESYPLLLQKRIVGPGLGVFLLSWDGATVAVFAHRSVGLARVEPPKLLADTAVEHWPHTSDR